MSTELERVYKHIDDHLDEHVARIQASIRQKSISPTGEGIKECAELFVRFYKDIGCQDARVVDVGTTKWGMEGHPIAYGKYDAGAEKTVIFYIMYDTMPVPPEEMKLWKSPPWEARVIEWPPFPKVIMGRGATNSKGPCVAFINACDSIREAAGELPVNVIFVGEGDEERMSIGLHKFVHDYQDELREADALYWIGRQDRNGMATGYGIGGESEGCIYFDLETSGEYWGRGPMKHSVHGVNKRILDSPAWRHIKMLSTLVSEDGNKVMVEGWYDNVEPPTEGDLRLLDELVARGYSTPEEQRRILGAKVFINDVTDHKEFLKMRYFDNGTTLNLDGIWGGRIMDTGAGAILPHKITSKHNCRYIPNQNGDDLINKIRKHLDKNGYKDVKMRVIGNVDWRMSNPNTEIGRACVRMYEKFGIKYNLSTPPAVTSSVDGPYWPACLFGKSPLNLPIGRGSIGHGGGAHAVNEYWVVEGAGKVYGEAGAEKSMATVLYYYAGNA